MGITLYESQSEMILLPKEPEESNGVSEWSVALHVLLIKSRLYVNLDEASLTLKKRGTPNGDRFSFSFRFIEVSS